MPALKDTLRRSTDGYEQIERPMPFPKDEGHRNDRLNRSIRCPLPPFNAGPDTLRQFNEDGSNPHRRVIPLPVMPTGGGDIINNTNTTIIQSGTPSGGSTSLAIKTATFTTGLLAPGNGESATIAMSKSFQLISCSVSGAGEFRLYGDVAAQAADSTRATDDPVPAEILNNLITDLVFDTAPYVWQWQNRVGTNSQNPQTSNTYITVINTEVFLQALTVSIVYLPLEV